MGRQETNLAGCTIDDVAQCSNCGHQKVFHGPDGCIPINLRQKDGKLHVISGSYDKCDCKEFDNRFIQIMGDDRRFHSVVEAREAGALPPKRQD